jgi:hypothetical protein
MACLNKGCVVKENSQRMKEAGNGLAHYAGNGIDGSMHLLGK